MFLSFAIRSYHCDVVLWVMVNCSQLRWTGTISRKQVLKERWLVVDATNVMIYKRHSGDQGDDYSTSPVYYTFPLSEVTSSRIVQPPHALIEATDLHYGLRVSCGKETVDLFVPSDDMADKWLSCINWNQLVLSRKPQEQHGPGLTPSGGGHRPSGSSIGTSHTT